VSTPIPSLQEFSDVVLLPQNAEEWSSAIAESLSPAANLPNQEIKRQKIARGQTGRYLLDALRDYFDASWSGSFPRLNQSSGVKKVALFENPDFRTQRKNFAHFATDVP